MLVGSNYVQLFGESENRSIISAPVKASSILQAGVQTVEFCRAICLQDDNCSLHVRVAVEGQKLLLSVQGHEPDHPEWLSSDGLELDRLSAILEDPKPFERVSHQKLRGSSTTGPFRDQKVIKTIRMLERGHIVEFGCNRLRALVVLVDKIELIFTIAEDDGVVEHLGVLDWVAGELRAQAHRLFLVITSVWVDKIDGAIS
jgi:hypothetical protein